MGHVRRHSPAFSAHEYDELSVEHNKWKHYHEFEYGGP